MFNAKSLVLFLLDHISEGILIYNSNLEVSYANQQAELLLNIPHNNLISSKAEDILDGLLVRGEGILSKAIETRKMTKQNTQINQKSIELTAYDFANKQTPEEESYKIVMFKDASQNKSSFHHEIKGKSPDETSTNDIEKQEVTTHDFANKILSAISDLSEAKNIKVLLNISPVVPKIYINPELMEFSVMNLLGKAIKFSNKGPLTLSFSETSTGYADLIKIENSNENIPQSDYDSLIANFSKGTDKAKNNVEKHGGKLWIDIDRGFTISFSLPKKLD